MHRNGADRPAGRRDDEGRSSPESDGVRQSFPVVAAGVAVSICSLLGTVVVARLLPTIGYGTLIKLLGLFLVLSMPGTALQVGVVRRTTSWEVQRRYTQTARWMARVHRLSLAVVLAFAVVVFLIRDPLISAMNLPGPSGVVEIITAGALFVLVAMDRGLLQARRDYRSVSANLIVEGGVRTAAMIALAAVYGLEGAAVGILLSEVAAFLHVRAKVRRALDMPPRRGPVAEPANILALDTPLHTRRDLMSDVLTAAVSLFFLAVLQNADVIVLGSRSPGNSGAYAAISVPSKALVFWTLVLVNYLLPEAAIRFHQGAAALRQLGYTTMAVAAPAAFLMAIALIAPRWFIDLAFGAKYHASAPGLAPLVLAMFFLCISVALASYLLGVGSRSVVAVLAAGAGGLVTACLLVDGRIVSTARGDLGVEAALCAGLTVLFLATHRRITRLRDRRDTGGVGLSASAWPPDGSPELTG